MNEPAHHARYRRAWELYCDPTCSFSNKKILEKEMDSAQESFDFNEFKDFVKTLPGFMEFLDNAIMELLEEIFKDNYDSDNSDAY